MVGQSLLDMIYVIICLFEEGSDMVIIHLVIDGIAITPGFDQTTFP